MRFSFLFLLVVGTIAWRGRTTASPFGWAVRAADCLFVEKIEGSRAQGGLGRLGAGSPLGGRRVGEGVFRRPVSRGASHAAAISRGPGGLSLNAGPCGVPAKGEIRDAIGRRARCPISKPIPPPQMDPFGLAHSPHGRWHRAVQRPGFSGRPNPELGWKYKLRREEFPVRRSVS